MSTNVPANLNKADREDVIDTPLSALNIIDASNGNGASPLDQEVKESSNTGDSGAGDGTDSRGIPGFLSFSRVTTTRIEVKPEFTILRSTAASHDYAMDHPKRGKALIINNRIFDLRTGLNERNGTQIDGDALVACFTRIGFEVDMLADGNFAEIRGRLKALSQEDHSQNDCLVVCILSHGEKGSIWARDIRYPVDEVYHIFTGDKCPSLAGKPKLFFVQACQGSEFDRGTMVMRNDIDVADSASYYKIPTWADFLIVYSTVSGYYSWRNPSKGSWFIQALTNVFARNAKSMDVLSMMTLVNQQVAYDFESIADSREFHGNKQVPCITSMLTRRVFF